MKIEVKSWRDDTYGSETQNLSINGKEELYVHGFEDCPEDAIIGRGLVSCIEIVKYMRMAYEAGKNGEAFDYTILNEGL